MDQDGPLKKQQVALQSLEVSTSHQMQLNQVEENLISGSQ